MALSASRRARRAASSPFTASGCSVCVRPSRARKTPQGRRKARRLGIRPSRAMKDFKIPRKEIQVFRNEIQAGWNKFQIRRNEIQIQILELPFTESSLIKGLRRPPKAASGLGSAAAAWGCSFAWLVCRSFDLRLLFLRSRDASEGLAPFLRSRTLGRRLSDWAAEKPHCAKRGTLASSDHHPEDRGKRQADRSDARQECVRFNEPEPKRRDRCSKARVREILAGMKGWRPSVIPRLETAARGGSGRFPSGAFGRLSSSDGSPYQSSDFL